LSEGDGNVRGVFLLLGGRISNSGIRRGF